MNEDSRADEQTGITVGHKPSLSEQRMRLLEHQRNKLSAYWTPLLNAYDQVMRDNQRYLYEFSWRTTEEIEALKVINAKKINRNNFIDLVLIFGTGLIINLLLLVVIFLVIDAS